MACWAASTWTQLILNPSWLVRAGKSLVVIARSYSLVANKAPAMRCYLATTDVRPTSHPQRAPNRSHQPRRRRRSQQQIQRLAVKYAAWRGPHIKALASRSSSISLFLKFLTETRVVSPTTPSSNFGPVILHSSRRTTDQIPNRAVYQWLEYPENPGHSCSRKSSPTGPSFVFFFFNCCSPIVPLSSPAIARKIRAREKIDWGNRKSEENAWKLMW